MFNNNNYVDSKYLCVFFKRKRIYILAIINATVKMLKIIYFLITLYNILLVICTKYNCLKINYHNINTNGGDDYLNMIYCIW